MTNTISIVELPAASILETVNMALAREIDSDPLEIFPLRGSLLEEDFFTGHISVSSNDIINIT